MKEAWLRMEGSVLDNVVVVVSSWTERDLMRQSERGIDLN